MNAEQLREIIDTGRVDAGLLHKMRRAAYIATIGSVNVELDGLAAYSALDELLAYREGKVSERKARGG